ncbi:MAG: N-6 DNA methylase [Paludibacteraceae bacterium]|nr:N-6 DNA methylase [Paludibacteraceae bacterium]
MATIFSVEELRTMFQSSFSMQTWYNCLQNLFNASELKVTPEKINNQTLENGYYLGNIDTVDSYRIGLFYYKITQGSVAKRKIGLRNFVRSFINPTWGKFEAALVVFDSCDLWRLSFICDIKGEATSPKRYTYVFGNQGILYRTPIERFCFLQSKGVSFENLKNAFSVEALSDEFFNEYRKQYADFIQYITGKRFMKVGSKWEEKVVDESNAVLMFAFNFDEKVIRNYIKKMMGRLTFLHFLQRKGWLCGDLNYLQNLFERSPYQDDYLDSVLEPLFFGILNTKPEQRKQVFERYNWDLALLKEWESIPYLNGGLFERDKEDEPESKFPADYFKRLFQFFSEYNFTIDENDPNDAEVGVDPEMLGKIFENLLEDNKDKGAFYTPKEIVRYMCQESLIAYLETNTSIAKEKIRQFVLSPDENVAEIPENKKPKLLEALKEVKICDPAIGSGAFPMGLLNELLSCREALEHLDVPRSEIKRSIIHNNIYGVDIEKGAVDIARLRFWLSIVVDEEKASPLPNLDYKIMQGNSLVESFMGVDLNNLSYKTTCKKDDTDNGLFDDEKVLLQKQVSRLLSKYYSCSDHEQKITIQQEISAAINKQLEVQSFDPLILKILKDVNLAGNCQFFLWHTWFSEVFNRPDGKSGFDIVIGNPPYVKELGNEKVFAPIINSFFGKKYHAGKMDYWYYFLHKAIELISDSGIISFITSRYWINSTGAKKIIKHVSEETKFINIVDIGKLKVFDNVVGYHMISILTKDKRRDTCQYFAISDDVKNIEKGLYTSQRLIKCNDLFVNNEIVLENRVFANTTRTLGDICNISQGVVEASDKISSKMYKKNPLPNHYVGQGIFVLSLDEYDNLDLNIEEKNIMVPFEDEGCLSRYYINYELTRRLIYSDVQNRKKISDSPQFVNLKRHLDYMSDYITSTYRPYGLHRARNYNDFIQPKLIGPSMFVQPCYCYDNQGLFVGMSYNIIIPKTETNLLFILGVINSKYAQNWFYCNAKHRGAGVDVGVEKLRSFPIPNPSKFQQEEIIMLVNNIIRKKRENPNVDISEEESKIDKLVYQLYELTDAEIKIIEESV